MRLARVMVLSAVVTSLAPHGVARAEPPETLNFMAGPVFGVRLGGAAKKRGSIGVEGGVGWAIARLNVGVTQRQGKTFSYVEIDPWYAVGATLGFGSDSDGTFHPVLGLWEGVPIIYPECGDDVWQPIVTLSFGYRYTGIHELYFAPKAGAIYDGGICIH